MNRAALMPTALWSMAKESVTAWIDDFAPSMGAAIAYYTVFSIAPLIIIVIAIAGFFFGADAASGDLFAQLGGLLGDEGAKAIQAMVESASDTGEGIIASAGQHRPAGDRRDDRLRRAAERPRPHLAGAGREEGGGLVGASAQPRAVAGARGRASGS